MSAYINSYSFDRKKNSWCEVGVVDRGAELFAQPSWTDVNQKVLKEGIVNFNISV